jgi:outer membrane protein assembly factor BamB
MNSLVSSLKTSISLLIAALTCSVSRSQPELQWAELVTPVQSASTVSDLISDGDGNAVMVVFEGRVDVGGGPSLQHRRVVKIAPDGKVLWRSTTKLPHIRSLAADQSGNIYVAGTRLGIGADPIPSDYFARAGITTEGSGTAYVAKLSPEGTLLFVREFGGTGTTNAIANAVVVAPDGTYYVSGHYRLVTNMGGELPVVSSGWDIFLARFAPNGEAQWVRTGSGNSQDLNIMTQPVRSEGFKLDQDGNINVRVNEWASYFQGAGITGLSPYFARFSPDGSLLSLVPTPEGGGPAARGTFDAEGNSFTISMIGEGDSVRVRKFDPAGGLLWTKEFLGYHINRLGVRIVCDGEGNSLIAFTFREIQLDDTTLVSPGRDALIAKLSKQGELLWAIQVEAERYPDDISVNLAVSSQQEVYFGGTIWGAYRLGDFSIASTRATGPRPALQPAFISKLVDVSPALPAISISKEMEQIFITWPTSAQGFYLESNAVLINGNWSRVEAQPVIDSAQYKLPVELSAPARFYRLRKE